MLRTLQWERSAAGLQLKRLLRPAVLTMTMFLLMRAELLLRTSPLAVAMMAAGLAAGDSAAALTIGCLLGMLRLPLTLTSLLPAISCVLVLATELALGMMRSLHIREDSRACAIAGFAVLLPAMIHAGGDLAASLYALASAALAASATPFLLNLLQLQGKHPAPAARTGAVLAWGGCIAGLWQLVPAAAEVLCALSVLVIPHPAAGAIAGLALSMGGAGLMKTAALSLCALAVGGSYLQRRWQKSLALCIAAGSVYLAAGSTALDPRWALCAAAAYPLLPESWLQFPAGFFISPRKFAQDPERIAREITRETRRRLTALGEVFAILAEEKATGADVPDEQELIQQMRSRLCAGCINYETCWAGADNRGAWLLCSLIGDALDRVDAPPGARTLFADGEIPPDVLRICRRGRMIPDRLGLLMRDFAEKRQSEIKRCTTDRLLAVQFMQAQQILLDLADRQAVAASGRDLQAALDCAGLPGCTAVEGTGCVHILGADPAWSPEQLRRAATVLGRRLGGRFRPKSDGEGLCFARSPRLHAETGESCQSGVAGESCGDHHLVRMLDENRLLLAISDGMGSGAAAADESRETLRLLWHFLDAGISRPLALETANRQLLMRCGEEIFATVDLCIIDLNSGIAEFTKLAACRSIVLRGHELVRVEGGQLPLGILERVQPNVSRIRLRPGDLLVMGSDGVMEAGDALLAERIARQNPDLPPHQLAEQLVRTAGLHPDHNRPDDRTCICVRIRSA